MAVGAISFAATIDACWEFDASGGVIVLADRRNAASGSAADANAVAGTAVSAAVTTACSDKALEFATFPAAFDAGREDDVVGRAGVEADTLKRSATGVLDVVALNNDAFV